MHVCVRVRERRLTYYWSLFVLACLLVVVACGIDRSSCHLAFLLGIASRPGAAQVDCGLDPSRFPPSPSDSHHGQQSMADDESLLPKRPPAAEAEEEGDQSRALSSSAERNTSRSKAAGI